MEIKGLVLQARKEFVAAGGSGIDPGFDLDREMVPL
jgi:hypothetical protein